MISLPLQNNTNFGIGPDDDTQNILNIQPVIPLELSEDWNLITRTIAPVIYQPEIVEGSGSEFGLGDINATLFFSPAEAGKITWALVRFFLSQRQRTASSAQTNGVQAHQQLL